MNSSTNSAAQSTLGDPERLLAARLNRQCLCISADDEQLRARIEAELDEPDGLHRMLEPRPHLLARWPVFVAERELQQMRDLVLAVESVVTNASYRRRVLTVAPTLARTDHGPRGVFMGFDFHLGADGPKLIEINSNAGGALLGLHLARTQRSHCGTGPGLFIDHVDPSLERGLVEMFRAECRRQGYAHELRHIAMVDLDPSGQFLYPEMRLFRALFEHHGIASSIVDPSELTLRNGALWSGTHQVDLVYNRLTDFYFESEAVSTLREAYLSGAAVVSPSPHIHALYANKRNITWFSDAPLLRRWDVSEESIATLTAMVPQTVLVTYENARALWSRRRELFFKPLAGYGSRGAYRGGKLTKRTWRQIVASPYVAQTYVPPSERRIEVDGRAVDLKVDLRCVVYDGEVQLVMARMYRGQTTNLRTAGGGLATALPVQA